MQSVCCHLYVLGLGIHYFSGTDLAEDPQAIFHAHIYLCSCKWDICTWWCCCHLPHLHSSSYSCLQSWLFVSWTTGGNGGHESHHCRCGYCGKHHKNSFHTQGKSSQLALTGHGMDHYTRHYPILHRHSHDLGKHASKCHCLRLWRCLPEGILFCRSGTESSHPYVSQWMAAHNLCKKCGSRTSVAWAASDPGGKLGI